MLVNGRDIIGIIKHKVGDKVMEQFHSHGVVNAEKQLLKGTVVYVHPCGRYYTVEFDFDGKKLRESYTVRSDIYDFGANCE